MRLNRRQRRSPGATDELLDQSDGEDELARTDTDSLDSDSVDDDLDGNGNGSPDDELDGDDATPSRRGGRHFGGGTMVEAPARPRPTVGTAPGAARTTPRQFLHEVNVEMRKVAWPSRRETINYASVVFITLAVLMALIFGLDYAFNHLSIFLFQ